MCNVVVREAGSDQSLPWIHGWAFYQTLPAHADGSYSLPLYKALGGGRHSSGLVARRHPSARRRFKKPSAPRLDPLAVLPLVKCRPLFPASLLKHDRNEARTLRDYVAPGFGRDG